MNQREELRKRTKEAEPLQRIDVKEKEKFIIDNSSTLLNGWMKQNKEWAIGEFGSADRAKYPNSALVKAVLRAHQQIIKFYTKRYSELIKHNKDNYFPCKWMRNGKNDDIVEMLENRYPVILAILNYVDKLNRGIKGEALKKMFKNDDEIIGNQRHKTDSGLRRYSGFVNNNYFLTTMSNEIEYKLPTVKKRISNLVKLGIWKDLGNVTTKDRKGYVGRFIADGYFIQRENNRYRKVTFLTADHKNTLRSLPDLLRLGF
ncbi:MAG: hypothetical protein L6406_14760 [Desulfobacterales bacterium]|nr:hypothetical protein [Desulfobacterales bacterium]